MSIRGIGVEGVASEIGALSRYGDDFVVNMAELVAGLCRRFGATEDEANWAINCAIEVGVIEIRGEEVVLL